MLVQRTKKASSTFVGQFSIKNLTLVQSLSFLIKKLILAQFLPIQAL